MKNTYKDLLLPFLNSENYFQGEKHDGKKIYEYDVVVVGSGAGGAISADIFSKRR